MSTPDLSDGAPLRPIAEWFGALGWQLVPTHWHTTARGSAGQTPISGVTGGVPFQEPAAACPDHLRLHRHGGPDTTPTSGLAKPAVRPPDTVLGLDVDDGYAEKGGGATLRIAERHYGPLPDTYTLTARGPWTPSRRMWFRVPADLVVKDDFFAKHGGSIETIRTGHRYSWAAPAVHVRKGETVGPVEWYDPDRAVCWMPSVDDLPDLPEAWVSAMRGHRPRTERSAVARTGRATREAVTADHALAVVAKVTTRLYDHPPHGGEFRNALFAVAWATARLARGRNPQVAQVAIERDVRAVLEAHPWGLHADPDDLQWIEDGVLAGMADAWDLVPTLALQAAETERVQAEGLPRERVITPAVARIARATDDEVESFLASYTRYDRPARLGARVEWMTSARPEDLFRHARALCTDAIAGYVPAARVVTALRAAYTAAGGQDVAVVRDLVAHALGSILNAKAGAR